MAKKATHCNFIVELVVYPFDVLFSFGETDDQLRSTIAKTDMPKELLHEVDEVCNLPENIKGRTYVFSTGATLVRMPAIPVNSTDFGTLAHEIFHVVDFLFRRIRLKLSKNSDEAYAYLIGYITEQVYSQLNKHL